jgi:hypothetical protein
MKYQYIGAVGAVAAIKHVRSKRLSWKFCLFDSPQALSLYARISRQRLYNNRCARVRHKCVLASIMASATQAASEGGKSTSAPEDRGGGDTPSSCRAATRGHRGHRCRHAHCLAALRVACPHVRQDEPYTMYPLAICDNLAKHVGILRQSCRERKKTWEHVPPSCRVATRGRRGDRSRNGLRSRRRPLPSASVLHKNISQLKYQ